MPALLRRVHLPQAGTGGVVVGALAVGFLVLETLGFLAGGAILTAVAGLIVLSSVVLLTRPSIRSVAWGSTWLAAFTLPWNGWQYGPVRLGDLFLLLALLCWFALEVGTRLPQLPLWVKQVGFVTVLVIALHELIPTDPRYLAGRTILDAAGQPTIEILSNLQNGPKLVVTLVAIPLVFAFAARRDRRAPAKLAVAYAVGSAISGFVAFSDSRGLTTLGQQITGNVTGGDRQGGLSDHPNFLAASCVLSISLAIWMVSRPGTRNRMIGGFTCLGVLLGLYASGSRGGAVAGLLAVILSVALDPRFRRHLATVALIGAVIATSAFVAYPQSGQAVLKAMRLTSSSSASGSNYVRSLVGEQAIHDFEHSPVDGIGFQVAAEAQDVFLQELASGGLLLFLSLQIYLFASMWAAWRLRRVDALAGPLFVAIVAGAAMNYVGASLTDRFNYVPQAILVALAVALAKPSDERAPEPLEAIVA